MSKEPNWGKIGVITAWAIGVPTVGLTALSYLRPPDPAHPASLDFLSKTLTINIWLSIGIVSGLILISAAIAWKIAKKKYENEPRVLVKFSSDGPKARVLERHDPRLTISVQPLKNNGFANCLGVLIRNDGGSEAHNVRLADVPAGKHTIEFPSNIPVISQNSSSHLIAPRIASFGPLVEQDMARAMLDDWDRQTQGKVVISEKIVFPASATYEDFQGTHFTANWNYELHTFRHMSSTKRQQRGTSDFLPDTNGPTITVSAVKTEIVYPPYEVAEIASA